ncbi:MAG: hypothetical protein ACOYLB_01910 [Phototrophicaceae bacterium]
MNDLYSMIVNTTGTLLKKSLSSLAILGEFIVSSEGNLVGWMEQVPGLKDYIDRAERRNADTTLREYLADQLTKRLSRLHLAEQSLLDSGGLAQMSQTREVKTKLQSYIDRVRAAAPGYAGLFATTKIEANELEQLHAFDEAQVRYLALFDQKLTALETAIQSQDGVDGALRDLYALANEAMQAFQLREDVLTQLDQKFSSKE